VSPLLEDDDTRGGTLHIAVKPLLHNVGKHVEDYKTGLTVPRELSRYVEAQIGDTGQTFP
jgi:hypothetical protein